mmetsp:Transcript_34987/g.82967  ORF Transcript_34987/g.82967 Transcript_34987/m.82967 type:complete len:493 (-) Transcript_34987:190-1668(-)
MSNRVATELVKIFREYVRGTFVRLDPHLSMMLNRILSQFDDSDVARFLLRCVTGARDRLRPRQLGSPEPYPEPHPEPEPQAPRCKTLEIHLTGDAGKSAPQRVVSVMKRLDADCMRLTDHGLLTPPDTRHALPVIGTDITATVSWGMRESRLPEADRLGRFHMAFEMRLSSPTMSIQGLTRWLDDIVAQDAARFPCQMLLTVSDFDTGVSEFRSPRTFENTFFPNKALIRESIGKAKAAGSCLGMFLCGLPGCGKTSMAQALLNELGPDYHGFLISARGPAVIRSHIFSSGMNFGYKNSSYCVDPSHRVLIFDEMDRLPFCQTRSDQAAGDGEPPPKRQKKDQDTRRRHRASRRRRARREYSPSSPVFCPDSPYESMDDSRCSPSYSPGPRDSVGPVLDVGQFLEMLSGVQPRSCWIIGMTNYPERIDEALLRRGRFGDIVVDFRDGLPLCCKEEIFEHVAGRSPDPEERAHLDKVIKSGSDAEGFADARRR